MHINLDNLEKIKVTFSKWAGSNPDKITSLPITASGRLYYRCVLHDQSAIAVINNDKKENEAFIYLSQQLKINDVNVPEIYVNKINEGIYLLEDLGDNTLFNILKTEDFDADLKEQIYKSVIEKMPLIQIASAHNLDFSKCYPRPEFDEQSIMWDLNYFKYYFLKLAKILFYEQDLENDFHKLTSFLLETNRNYFMFRDFQSRNIMVKNDNLYFIDYQGGRKGALQYDLASLLFEAKTKISHSLRKKLYHYYIDIFNKNSAFNKSDFIKYFYSYALIRILQAMGAYGFRGIFERKHFFLQSIPAALKNLEWLLNEADIGISIPHLRDCLKRIIASDFFNQFNQDQNKKLTVTINSFAYKNGIPIDNTPNGGGFVFDCRALPNPGRFEEYRAFTGVDTPVIDFLKSKTEVENFLTNSLNLISNSIQDYLNRNFNHLMVNFGCTGGQHRSVYCAEVISKKIKEKFDVNIVLNHKELKI